MSPEDEQFQQKKADILEEDREAAREWKEKHKHDLLISMVEPWPVKLVRKLFEKKDPHIEKVDPFKR